MKITWKADPSKWWKVPMEENIFFSLLTCGKFGTYGPWLLLDRWLGILHTNPELPVGPTLKEGLSKENPGLKFMAQATKAWLDPNYGWTVDGAANKTQVWNFIVTETWHIVASFQLKCTLYRQIRRCLIYSCSSNWALIWESIGWSLGICMKPRCQHQSTIRVFWNSMFYM